MKSKGKLANALFFLSLLCVFVICSVIVVTHQINGYHRILNENEVLQNQSMVVSYLRNQVRFHDGRGQIQVENMDGIDVLVLHQKETTTYLYVYEGALKEFYAKSDFPLTLEDGEDLFKVDNMTIKHHQNRLELIITNQGQEQTILITLQCEGGNFNA